MTVWLFQMVGPIEGREAIRLLVCKLFTISVQRPNKLVCSPYHKHTAHALSYDYTYNPYPLRYSLTAQISAYHVIDLPSDTCDKLKAKKGTGTLKKCFV